MTQETLNCLRGRERKGDRVGAKGVEAIDKDELGKGGGETSITESKKNILKFRRKNREWGRLFCRKEG